MTDVNNYDSTTALDAYYVDRTERRPARIWSIEKLALDLAEIGLFEIFTGAGTNPTGLTGYSTSKIWLQVSSGVTSTAGTVRAYDGSGNPALLASWPAMTPTTFRTYVQQVSVSDLSVMNRTVMASNDKLWAYKADTLTDVAIYPTFALRVFDVTDPQWGAIPNEGTTSAATNDTAFNNCALALNAAGGGIMYIPPGTYYKRQACCVFSNTHVMGAGDATVLKADVAGWAAPTFAVMFHNQNHTATSLTDSDIRIENFTIDYNGLTVPALKHAVYMKYVDRVHVSRMRFINGENGTALLGCRDTVTEDCVAEDVLNCGFDHWFGFRSNIVRNCTVRGSEAQGIQFTGTGTAGEDLESTICMAIGNSVHGVRSAINNSASGIIFNAVDPDSAMYRGTSIGNHIEDCDLGLVFDGAGGQHTSIGDRLVNVDYLPLFIKETSGDSPANCKIIDPHLIDCDHSVGNLAMISIAGTGHDIRGVKVTNTSSAAYNLIATYATGSTNCRLELVECPTGSDATRFTNNGDGTNVIVDIINQERRVYNEIARFPNSPFKVRDSNDTNNLALTYGANLTSDRTLTLKTADADATLDLGAWVSYTPTLSAAAGTFTSAAASGAYAVFGKTILFRITVVITTNGTASGYVIATLPVTATAAPAFSGKGRESSAGVPLYWTNASTTTVAIWKEDGTYPGANGYTIWISGMYEAA